MFPRISMLLTRYLYFQFSYGKPIHKRENPSCCKLLSFPCWRHCLKTVKIVNLRGFADREILNNYFVENAKTLENFQFHVGGIAWKVSRLRTLKDMHIKDLNNDSFRLVININFLEVKIFSSDLWYSLLFYLFIYL